MRELSIEQMVRLNGLSEQTLRLYDKVGLFPPMYRDAEDGYRYYDIRQSVQLDMIQHVRALDMSLKDIGEQMTRSEFDIFKTILHRNLEELELGSKELMYQRGAMGRTFESYERCENAPLDGTIVLEYIPRRLTYMIGSGVNFCDYDIDVHEKIPRDLKENLIANQLSLIYFHNIGTVMRREYLMEGRCYSMEIFILVNRGFIKNSLITKIPASTYLRTYCNGSERGKEYIGCLVEEIRTKKCQVTGGYICKMVAEVPMDMQERGMFLHLQMPVSFRKNNP